MRRALSAKPPLGWDAMLAYLSPSLCGLSSLPGFGVLERIIMDDDELLKKAQFEQKKAVSNNVYFSPRSRLWRVCGG